MSTEKGKQNKFENYEEIRKKFDPLVKKSIFQIQKRFKMDFRLEKDDLEQEVALAILNVMKNFEVEKYTSEEHAYASFINYIKTSLFRSLNRYCSKQTKCTNCTNVDSNTELSIGIKDNFYIIKA